MANLERLTKDELYLNVIALMFNISVCEAKRICREYLEQRKQEERAEREERTPKEKQGVLK